MNTEIPYRLLSQCCKRPIYFWNNLSYDYQGGLARCSKCHHSCHYADIKPYKIEKKKDIISKIISLIFN